MKLTHLCICCLLAAFSCATVDMEKVVKTSKGAGKQETGGSSIIAVPIDVEIPREITVIEKPVYIPQSSPPPVPAQGRAAVEQSNREGIAQPGDYSASAMIYDYHRDWVYEVYCRPLRVTDIRLKPGEKAADAPFISDSERWMLGAGTSYEEGSAVQHIYVKPTQVSLEASLIINTTERVYHVILRSFPNVHMPMVRWRYFDTSLPRSFSGDSSAASASAFTEGTGGTEPDSSLLSDPRFLSFNYRITYSLFKKPRWLPSLVHDDGKKTYITFPETVLQRELPAVFENRADIVNYRVLGSLMIIDKLIEKITVKLDGYQITIEKKRGA
jgi:type IV secretion system protein VirB9